MLLKTRRPARIRTTYISPKPFRERRGEVIGRSEWQNLTGSIRTVFLAYPDQGIQVGVRDWRQAWYADRFASMLAKKISWKMDPERCRRGVPPILGDARPVIASWCKIGELFPVGSIGLE